MVENQFKSKEEERTIFFTAVFTDFVNSMENRGSFVIRDKKVPKTGEEFGFEAVKRQGGQVE